MPNPQKNEKKSDFTSRCTKELIEKEGYKPDQARAICESKWDKSKKKGSADMNKIPYIMDSVTNIPWAILPAKLNEIMIVLQSKNSGIAIEMAEKNKQTEEQDENYYVKDGIAYISIEGTLSRRMGMMQALSGGTSYANIQNQIQKAESDPAVKGIFYEYHSPGGNVDGMFNAADVIFNAKKPSLSFANGLMASAAYIMGSGANYVVASDRSAQIGSLGVIGVHFDESKKYEKEGIKPTVFSAGKYKASGNPYEPLSKKDADQLQSQLDYMYSLAVDTVSRNRNVSADKIINLGADVFIGKQAVSAGFADEILTKSQAIDCLKEMIAGNNYNKSIEAKGGVENMAEKNELEVRIEALEADLKSKTDEISALKTQDETKALGEKITELEADVETLTTSESALSDQIKDLKAEIEASVKHVAIGKKAIESIKADLKTISVQVKGEDFNEALLARQISAMGDDFESLEMLKSDLIKTREKMFRAGDLNTDVVDDDKKEAKTVQSKYELGKKLGANKKVIRIH